MDRLVARRLLNQQLGLTGVPSRDMKVTADAKGALDTNGDGKVDRDELLTGLVADTVSFDPKLKQILANRSRLPIDSSITPNPKSALFDTVEQCMEFVQRYFKESRAKAGLPGASFDQDFGPQHDLADTVRQMSAGALAKPGYSASLNGGITPPRAGDVLSAESSDGSEFHIALVAGVEPRGNDWQVTVYQANVPFNVRHAGVEANLQRLTMTNVDGKWSIQRLPTSKAGYGDDMDVVGWIHPIGNKAIPGAAP